MSKGSNKSRSFSIFLLKSDVKAPADALKAGHALVDTIKGEGLPDGAVLYVLDTDARPIWWAGYFGLTTKLEQMSKGALVFLPVGGRWFALSFGHVGHYLDDEKYEHDFGLRVTLNAVDPDLIRSTDILQPSGAKRQRIQLPKPGDLTLFDFDQDSTILKSLTGKTRVSVKTKKLRGKAIVRGGAGTATRTVGLLGGILTYAVEAGIIDRNPAHGLKKPKDNVRNRRLTEAEYHILGDILRNAAETEKYAMTVDIIRQIAMTGCRRTEMIRLMRTEVDAAGSCLRLVDSKEGASVRPIGLPVVEYLEERCKDLTGTYVFPGQVEDNAFGSFPNHWEQIFKDTPLADVTPHVLRHSFASIGNDLGFTEVTIAALVGHSKGSVTSKYIHSLDTALIMAADTISGYIKGLLDGVAFKQTAYALDRDSRKAALARFLQSAAANEQEELPLAA